MSVASISRKTADHYSWGQECDGCHLVKDAALSVIEERMPPGSSELLHCHSVAQQFFFILYGEVIMEVGQGELRLSAGEGVRIPPRILHRISNRSNEAARFLVISQPPSHGDRVSLTVGLLKLPI